MHNKVNRQALCVFLYLLSCLEYGDMLAKAGEAHRGIP